MFCSQKLLGSVRDFDFASVDHIDLRHRPCSSCQDSDPAHTSSLLLTLNTDATQNPASTALAEGEKLGRAVGGPE